MKVKVPAKLESVSISSWAILAIFFYFERHDFDKTGQQTSGFVPILISALVLIIGDFFTLKKSSYSKSKIFLLAITLIAIWILVGSLVLFYVACLTGDCL